MIDVLTENEIIKAAKAYGLGREIKPDGSVGDFVVNIDSSTLEIEEVNPNDPQSFFNDPEKRVIDDIIGNFYPCIAPIPVGYIRIGSLLISAAIGYLISNITRHLSSSSSRELVPYIASPKEKKDIAAGGGSFALVMGGVEKFLLPVTGWKRIYEKKYKCTIKPLKKDNQVAAETSYLETAEVTVRHFKTKRNESTSNFIHQAAQVLEFNINKKALGRYHGEVNDYTELFDSIVKSLHKIKTKLDGPSVEDAELKRLVAELQGLQEEVDENLRHKNLQKFNDDFQSANKIMREIKERYPMAITEPPEMKIAKDFLDNAQPNLETLRGNQPTVFLIGPTKSGKSSLTNALMGHELIKKIGESLPLVKVYYNDLIILKILRMRLWEKNVTLLKLLG